ncbi:hypothetical protein IMSAGC020_01192 [Lachnospiraceae bacterium]|nr:hypothetical protein IMSAGC020_01192 [Lachnospiraceae bacterium]
MHPAHIPLQAESQAVILHTARHHRPCRRLLRDHHRPRIPAKHDRIQMLKEVDRLQVLIPAIFVRNPLSILLAIIKIEHRRHCVHTKPVHMELLHPVQRIRDQEITHFILTIVKYLRAPVRMLSLLRIRIFISRSPVKISKPMDIPWEMRRHPVQYHTNLVPVKIIDHPCEILRRTIPGSRRKIPDHLVSPGTVERMLRDTDQFHMRIAHILKIRRTFLRKFTIIIKTFIFASGMPLPRTNMRLIDRHRLFRMLPGLAVLHPYIVRPRNLRKIGNLRCRPRP